MTATEHGRAGVVAPLSSMSQEQRLWLEAIFSGPMNFNIVGDSGSTIQCKLCHQEWHRSEVFGLYAQDRRDGVLVQHIAAHLAHVPESKRDSIFSLIRLGSEWNEACKEILGVSPQERAEWIRFWRLPEP